MQSLFPPRESQQYCPAFSQLDITVWKGFLTGCTAAGLNARRAKALDSHFLHGTTFDRCIAHFFLRDNETYKYRNALLDIFRVPIPYRDVPPGGTLLDFKLEQHDLSPKELWAMVVAALEAMLRTGEEGLGRLRALLAAHRSSILVICLAVGIGIGGVLCQLRKFGPVPLSLPIVIIDKAAVDGDAGGVQYLISGAGPDAVCEWIVVDEGLQDEEMRRLIVAFEADWGRFKALRSGLVESRWASM